MTNTILRLLDKGYNVSFVGESVTIFIPGNEIRNKVELKRFFSLRDIKEYPIVIDGLLLNMEKEMDAFYKKQINEINS